MVASNWHLFVIFLIFVRFPGNNGETADTEEHIVGLEEFLTDLDPNTSDVILDLLEAQQLPTTRGNRAMRRIMRKLPPQMLARLFEIYKEIHEQ